MMLCHFEQKFRCAYTSNFLSAGSFCSSSHDTKKDRIRKTENRRKEMRDKKSFLSFFPEYFYLITVDYITFTSCCKLTFSFVLWKMLKVFYEGSALHIYSPLNIVIALNDNVFQNNALGNNIYKIFILPSIVHSRIWCNY